MTTRHEFLEQLHELLKPKVYLEIGVQHGWSLQLSKAELSIGIDPEPLISSSQLNMPNEVFIAKQTSDDFFETYIKPDTNFGPIDLAFIDGMHLAEFAWRDFINVAKYCHAGSVVVFDDVLPYTSEMAAREQCPGDWTGDVWHVYYALRQQTEFTLALVDTEPTGTLVVTGFDGWPQAKLERVNEHVQKAMSSALLLNILVPRDILDRRHAWSAPVVLENLKDRGFGA